MSSSNRDRRIDRLLPGLSAQERAIFALRQYKSGADHTLAILATMPRDQAAAYNRYVRLMNTVNCDLGPALLLLNAQVRQIDIKYAWLLSVLFLSGQIEDARYEMLRATKDPKLRRMIRRLVRDAAGSIKVPVDLTIDIECKDAFPCGLVRALLRGIRDGLDSHWRELRTIEIVVEETAEEFGGEDPLRPATRRLIDDAKMRCVKLCEDIRPYVARFELVDPTDEEVDLVRRLVASQVSNQS